MKPTASARAIAITGAASEVRRIITASSQGRRRAITPRRPSASKRAVSPWATTQASTPSARAARPAPAAGSAAIQRGSWRGPERAVSAPSRGAGTQGLLDEDDPAPGQLAQLTRGEQAGDVVDLVADGVERRGDE